MNRRLFAVFAFALLVAGSASFALYKLLVNQVHAPVHVMPANMIVVARHDLTVGALIREDDLTETSWSAPVPAHAITTRQDLIGRGVTASIFANEPILEARLAQKGAGGGLAATIPVGMRAVALRVNDVVGLAGFVLPGMRVDVLITGIAPGTDASKTGTLCKTVLQNIEVLSAGQKIEKNNEGKPESAQVVNLLVTPDQAEILDLASGTNVQLVLRNPLDTKEQDTRGSTLAQLFGEPAKAATLPSPPVVHPTVPKLPTPIQVHRENTIEVFNGAKRIEQTFAAPQER